MESGWHWFLLVLIDKRVLKWCEENWEGRALLALGIVIGGLYHEWRASHLDKD